MTNMKDSSKFYKKTLFLSIIIFIIVSMSFFYLADLSIKKIDEKLGIKSESIIIFNIIKSYDSNQENPIINVNYITLKKSTSYIKIGNIRSESSYGINFSKTIVMDSSYSGKNVNITIIAIDDGGKDDIIIREVMLPKRIDSDIRITG